MIEYIESDDESFLINRKKYFDAAESLWLLCKDLGISYSIPNDK